MQIYKISYITYRQVGFKMLIFEAYLDGLYILSLNWAEFKIRVIFYFYFYIYLSS